MRAYKPTTSSPTIFTHAVNESDSDTSVDDSEKEHLKAAAEIIATAVRNAAEPISKRTAESVHVEQSDDGTTQVVSGGDQAMMAYRFDPVTPPGRHPVFARGPRRKWHWADMPYRPYTEQGADKSASAAMDEYSKWLDDAIDNIGSARP